MIPTSNEVSELIEALERTVREDYDDFPQHLCDAVQMLEQLHKERLDLRDQNRTLRELLRMIQERHRYYESESDSVMVRVRKTLAAMDRE